MAKFRILRRVDAWIDYVAEIEAASADAAARRAYEGDASLTWSCIGHEEFANSRIVALDEDGEELAETLFTRG